MQISIVQAGGSEALEYISRAMDDVGITMIGNVADLFQDDPVAREELDNGGFTACDLYVFCPIGTEVTDELLSEILEKVQDLDYTNDPNYY